MIEKKKSGLTGKVWFIIIILDLVAKIGWSIENTWFTSYVYAEVSYDVNITSWMVAVSAVVSTITTLLFGTLSDRIGKRKPLIVYGFIAWGITAFMFAFGRDMSTLAIAGVFCIIMDGLMSGVGSIASDAGYMAWTTDMTDKKTRPALGAWLGVMPLISSVIVALIAGPIVDKLGYLWLFAIVGFLVSIFGVFAIFFVKDSPTLEKKKDGSYLHQLGTVFGFKSLKKNKALLMVLLAYGYYFIIFDAWMPYANVYIINYLGYTATIASYLQGIGIVLAALVTIPFTKLIKKGHEALVLSIVTVLSVVGCFTVGYAAKLNNPLIVLAIGVAILLAGYVGIEQTCTSWMKNLFPDDSHGQYEGMRMLFYVALPMVFGSLLANGLINKLRTPIADGVVINEKIFFILSALYVLVIVPSLLANKWVKKRTADSLLEENKNENN